MALELIYTSAARGLRPGTRGFCTVAYTKGMSPEYVRLLEALSVYNPLFPAHHPRAVQNPIAYSHCRYTLRGRAFSILSRVAPAVADHTGRSNKIAHHVLLNSRERPAGGPAWIASQDGFFLECWDREPHHITTQKEIPDGTLPTTRADMWELVTGDAGWAGVLAYTFLSRGTTPAYIIFEPGMNMLPLVLEAMALLHPEQRWEVTFNTFFASSLPAGASCLWRCCVPDSEGVREAKRNPKALVIDLTGPLDDPKENVLVTCAREGTPPPRRLASTGAASRRTGFVPMRNAGKSRLRMRPPRH